eukprot:jgi/Hompol1/985/HPOL_002624-RA
MHGKKSNVGDSSKSANVSAPKGRLMGSIMKPSIRRSGRGGHEHQACLVYTTSFGGRMTFTLVKDHMTIGRKGDNDIVLTDAKISKNHACIIKAPATSGHRAASRHSIIDLNSANGVRVNDELVNPDKPRPLHNGDTIMISSISLTYYENEAAANNNSDQTSLAFGSATSKSAIGTLVDPSMLNLVTILPLDAKGEPVMAIKAELEADMDTDFRRVDEVTDIATLKQDYEKLRLAYELSKITLTNDMAPHIEKALNLMFEILPIDRGVVLLVDQNTGTLITHHVKLREGAEEEGKEILLSSTIIRKVYESRKCLITTDARQDTALRAAESVQHGKFRSVICVPLIAHNKIHGILHLDSADAVNRFSNKD